MDSSVTGNDSLSLFTTSKAMQASLREYVAAELILKLERVPYAKLKPLFSYTTFAGSTETDNWHSFSFETSTIVLIASSSNIPVMTGTPLLIMPAF